MRRPSPWSVPLRSLRVAALAAAVVLGPTRLVAQDTIPRPDSTPPPPPSPPPPVVVAPPEQAPPPPTAPAPTPEQERYLDGLRSVSRGVAQLRDGIDRVVRTQQTRDTVRQRAAGQRLGGLCQSARTFMATGRPRMQPSAYSDSMRLYARQLVVRVDSVLKALPACAQAARKTPATVAADLLNRLRAYETALAAFRTGLFPPASRPDSLKTPRR